jgi:hypothetical protein
MGKFKIGDSVILKEYGIRKDLGESTDWAKYADIPLNTALTIVYITHDNWLGFTGYRNYHPEGKFELYKEKPKNRFNVGDKVIGNDSKYYAITNSQWTGKVIKLYKDGEIEVEGLYDGNPKFKFRVEEKYFDLYNKTNNMSKKLTGYQLKKAIPGDNRSVGTVVSTEKSDYYELLTDFWTPIYKEVEEVIEIASYRAIFNKGYVQFGCQTFTRAEVEAIVRLWTIDSTVSFKLGETSVTRLMLNTILSKI